MHALKVCDLRLISSFDQRFESGFDQSAHAAAQDSLFAKKVRLCFLCKSRLDDPGARAADAFCVGESQSFGFAAGILMHSQESRCSAALCEDFAHTVTGRFWRDHDDVDVSWRLDGLEVNIEPVCEQYRLAGRQSKRDSLLIELWLHGIGYEEDQNVAPCSRVLWNQHLESGLARLRS